MSWRIYLLAVFVLIFSACGSGTDEESSGPDGGKGTLEQMVWLEGTWVNESSFGFQQPPLHLHERWTVYPDSLSGALYNVRGEDTSYTERVALMMVNDKLTYVARPKGKAMITFTITSSSDNEWVFENKANDYPQKFIYKKLPNDSLQVTLKGIQNTMERTVDLKYHLKK